MKKDTWFRRNAKAIFFWDLKIIGTFCVIGIIAMAWSSFSIYNILAEEPTQNEIIIKVTHWNLVPQDGVPVTVRFAIQVDLNKDGNYDKEFDSPYYVNVQSVTDPLSTEFLVNKDIKSFTFRIIVDKVQDSNVTEMKYYFSEETPVHQIANDIRANDTWHYVIPEYDSVINSSDYCSLLFFYLVLPINGNDSDIISLGQTWQPRSSSEIIFQGLFTSSIMLIAMGISRFSWVLIRQRRIELSDQLFTPQGNSKQSVLEAAHRFSQRFANIYGAYFEILCAIIILFISYQIWDSDVFALLVVSILITASLVMQLVMTIWMSFERKKFENALEASDLIIQWDENN